jgi:hypothetical protein
MESGDLGDEGRDSMARIRTIKPVFARHEKLQELESGSPVLRPMLTFCCLWTQCDREGRFEWRPRQLKLDVLPFVDYDLEATMELLAAHDFIRKYEAGGRWYGYVPTWCEHQCPNVREPASKIPAPVPKEAGMVGELTEDPTERRIDLPRPFTAEIAEERRDSQEKQKQGTGLPETQLQTVTGTDGSSEKNGAGMVQESWEREREGERKKGNANGFNAAEAARAIAVERGWSGLRVIEQIRLAIVALQARDPQRKAGEIAEWLLRRTHEYDRSGKVKAGFRMSWEKFFGEAHYSDAPESWECANGGGDPRASGASGVAGALTEDATPLIRERQKKLEEFLARKKETAPQVQ